MRRILRRDFLKYAAAGASVAAVDMAVGGLVAPVTGSADAGYVDRSTEKRVKGIPTTCAGCGAGCGLMAYVMDGQLMKLGGNPAHPVNGGRLCLVGEAGIYRYEDPERVLRPLKRVGKRGKDRWKAIGWDDAMSLVADKIRGRGGGTVAVETRGGATGGATGVFLSALGGGTLVSHGFVVSPNREAAMTGI